MNRAGRVRATRRATRCSCGWRRTASASRLTAPEVTGPRVRGRHSADGSSAATASTRRDAARPSCHGLKRASKSRTRAAQVAASVATSAGASTTSSVVVTSGPGAVSVEGEEEAADAGGVVLQVGHQEDHRAAGQGVVEAQRGVVEHRHVGGEDQVVDLGMVGDVDHPGPRAAGRVEAVPAQQDHVGVAEGGGGGVDVEVLGHRRRARPGGEVVAPGGGVEHGGLVRARCRAGGGHRSGSDRQSGPRSTSLRG